MGYYTPQYTESDFARVLAREFPGCIQEAKAVLLQYAKESYHTCPLRVHMACLKLARGDIARLREYVQAACGDPRDVLAWAEYRHTWRAKSSKARAVAVETDWRELQEWLTR